MRARPPRKPPKAITVHTIALALVFVHGPAACFELRHRWYARPAAPGSPAAGTGATVSSCACRYTQATSLSLMLFTASGEDPAEVIDASGFAFPPAICRKMPTMP